jgi:hypothetical protein
MRPLQVLQQSWAERLIDGARQCARYLWSPIVVVRVIKQKTSAAVIIINLVLTFDLDH